MGYPRISISFAAPSKSAGAEAYDLFAIMGNYSYGSDPRESQDCPYVVRFPDDITCVPRFRLVCVSITSMSFGAKTEAPALLKSSK